MNILYSSDDNYAQHMGVSIYSLLKHNTQEPNIKIYVIDNEISDTNQHKLQQTVVAFKNAEIIFIPFSQWKSQLNLKMSWNISISAYARLFVAEMLPQEIEKVLYLDCDMIVCKSLHELWNTEIGDNVLGAVQDSVNPFTKKAIGLNPETPYFNSGLLLIDLKEWRKRRIGAQCLSFINKHNGDVTHHDQGTLNGILSGAFYILPINNNLMTIHYFFSRKKVLTYFQEQASFYTQEEIDTAKKDPVVLHYTPSFTSRPWCKDCKHPLRSIYWEYLSETPWKTCTPVSNKEKWYIRVINWRYRNLPMR